VPTFGSPSEPAAAVRFGAVAAGLESIREEL
jgi:hypothetical protein